MRKRIVLGALAWCLAGLVPGAYGSSVASDNFESYTSGSAAPGLNGGTGFTGAYTSDDSSGLTIATESLSYTNGALSISGASQDLQIGATPDNLGNAAVDNDTLDRAFSAQSGTLYFSFLLRTSAAATSNNEFFQVGLSNALSEPVLSVGASGTTAGAFDFFVRNPAGSGSQTTSTTLLSPSTTYFIVGEAAVTGNDGANFDQISLYVDPGATQPVTPTVSRSQNSGVSSLDSLNFRTARFSSGDVYSVDDVEIGTTYADVLDSVPEPATDSMLLLAGLGLGASYRPRRRAGGSGK